MSQTQEKGIIAWFASNPVAANLLMMSLLVVGFMVVKSMRVEVFPDVPPKFVSIDVVYESGSAADTEEGIILTIEEALQEVEGIKNITATATKSNASVRVERATDYDLDVLNSDIKNKVDAVVLPDSAEKPVITKATIEDEAITVQVTGDADAATLQETARRLRLLLLAEPEISKVTMDSEQEIELQLEVDEKKLQAYGLTLSEVAEQINATSFVSRGGELDSGDGNIIVKAGQQFYEADSFGDITVIKTSDGRQVSLSEIATIKEDFDDKAIMSRFNGQPSVALVVKMFGDSDILAITPVVEAVVEKFKPRAPVNIEVSSWNNQSDYIKERLNLISTNAIQGILIVGVLLALFLNLKVALWVAVGIPVTFAGAMILIGPVHGISINELSTFGFLMALGIVVDDAVVIGESIHHERTKYGATLDNTIRGAKRVALPTLFGVLTSVAAFQAIPFIKGEMGNIFGIFATVIVSALLLSMVESKLILPSHLAHMSTKPPHRWNYLAKVWGWVQTKFANGMNYFSHRIYRPFLYSLLPFRYAVFAASLAGIVLAVGLITSGRVGFVFFPDVPSDTISVSLVQENDVGYELTQSNVLKIEESVRQLNRELREQGETVDVISNIQAQSDKTSGTLTASLSPRSERSLGTKEVVAEWEKRVPALEGVASLNFVTSWQGASAIQIELRSENAETLQQASQAVMSSLRAIEGVKNPENNLKAGQAQIDLHLKPAGLAMGLSLEDLSSQVMYAYNGRDVQDFQRGEDEVTVRLRYPEGQRKNIADLQQMRVRLEDGTVVPLDAVATMETTYVNDEINRLNNERVATITSDVDKSIIAPALVNAQLGETLFPELLATYSDLSIELGGEAEQQAETAGSMVQLGIITLIVIYALLAIPLKSYFQPLIIMSAIPFGVIGALLGHWLYGLPLSILSIFGIVALSGVVVNDSLLLVSRFNELKESGMRNRKAVTEAASQRMRAVILTSVTTFAGLAPLMADTSENAQYLIPTALSIAYGSLFATVITLIIIPTLLLITADFQFSKKARQPRQLELKGVSL